METSSQPVSPLRQRMLEDMRMRKLAPKTQQSYIRAVSRFAKYLGRSPETVTAEDLRLYQLHLVDSRTSAITLNATITGLKFLFDVTLGHGDVLAKMQSVRVPHKIPVILNKQEVARLIACAGNLKHQTALALAYATGLRVNEVISLKVSDIDSQRMTLRVEQGKGGKDRYAMISPILLESHSCLMTPHSVWAACVLSFDNFLPSANDNNLSWVRCRGQIAGDWD